MITKGIDFLNLLSWFLCHMKVKAGAQYSHEEGNRWLSKELSANLDSGNLLASNTRISSVGSVHSIALCLFSCPPSSPSSGLAMDNVWFILEFSSWQLSRATPMNEHGKSQFIIFIAILLLRTHLSWWMIAQEIVKGNSIGWMKEFLFVCFVCFLEECTANVAEDTLGPIWQQLNSH